jgi:hypothetical protein
LLVDDDALQQKVPADSEEASVWVREGKSQEYDPEDGNVLLSRSNILRIDITRKIRIAFSSNIPVDSRLNIAAIFICMFSVQIIDDDVLLNIGILVRVLIHYGRTDPLWQIKYSEQFSGCD